ncbi:ArsR/SmtB family transcription factor [Methanomethylovorans sp.]|uniref:ArsR/SmtB family transcription factor n=1 Tax=Methanomethylovorans sp. TaxID=2758717 RepID=UPI003D09B179
MTSKYVDMNAYIEFSFLYNIMKCCPVDKDLKEEWEHELENEANIDENEINKLCNVFKVLSNPIRLKIAYQLIKQDYCVTALVYVLGEKQNLVSHHLAVMKENGVVDSYKSSRYTYYKLKPEVFFMLRARDIYQEK